METLELVDRQKKLFLEALKVVPHERIAARAASVSISLVRRWYEEDPDFNLECAEVKEAVVDEIEVKAFKLAQEGSENMIKFVLPALRPETWNPTHKVEVVPEGHRFVDFTGKDLHDEPDNPLQIEESSSKSP